MTTITEMTCFAILLFCIGSVRMMPVIEIRPTNVTTRLGHEALFECRVRDLRGGDVMWLKGSSGAIISRNTQALESPTAGEYIIEANTKRGDYNLKITRVQREDVDEYVCGFVSGLAIGRAGAYLQVLVEPYQNFPMCSLQSSSTNPAVGDSVNLMCLSNGGVPPANLTWYREGQAVSDTHQGVNDFEKILTPSDIDSVYECRAESPAITSMRTCSTTVRLAEPMVFVQPYTQKADVGETVTFLCNRQDKPSEQQFMWFFKGELIEPSASGRFSIGDHNRSLTIKNITTDDSSAIIKCVVSILRKPYTGRAYLMVSIMTGEVLGTLPPPNLVTDSLPGLESSSQGRRGEHDVSSPGMSVGNEDTKSTDKTIMYIIIGAGGVLFIVISLIVIKFVVFRREKAKDGQPKAKSAIKPVASGLSMMTTKDSEKSLSSSDSVVTTKTTTTTTSAPCPKRNVKSVPDQKEGCQYTELDSNVLRNSEYQGLNAPPMSIYAEPIVSPTRLVPRPEHQDGFHDYALPDILPELEVPPEEYVEPDPPPRNKIESQEEKKPNIKDVAMLDEKVLAPQSPDGVYIEIIA